MTFSYNYKGYVITHFDEGHILVKILREQLNNCFRMLAGAI
uniref:Uncharacterized protein n=1 Tax=Anguilla anguilla TaxID=7936 RepID=A0A0E9XYE4_ANGAN